jgi:hypothetical protein
MAQNAREGLCSLMSPGVSGPEADSWSHYVAALIRVKDEARFLPEWMAHHLKLGIEHIYVYDNGSSDGTRSVISPFLERGVATYVYWPTTPASPSCDLDFLRRFGSDNKWVAFFDADEFLFESSPGETLRVLRRHESWPAVAVNWRYFGSAGHKALPAGLVTERFTLADACGDDHVKVIAQPSQVFRCRNSHNFYYRRGRLAVTPQGRRAFGSFARRADEPVLVLHHYVYRSREDYERKLRRGYVDAGGMNVQTREASRTETEFHRHNEVVVAVPREITRATAQVLCDLGFPPSLYIAS